VAGRSEKYHGVGKLRVEPLCMEPDVFALAGISSNAVGARRENECAEGDVTIDARGMPVDFAVINRGRITTTLRNPAQCFRQRSNVRGLIEA